MIPHPAHIVAAVASVSLDQTVVAVAAIGGVTVLGFSGKVSPEAVVGLYTTVLGYVLGRASAVANGPVTP